LNISLPPTRICPAGKRRRATQGRRDERKGPGSSSPNKRHSPWCQSTQTYRGADGDGSGLEKGRDKQGAHLGVGFRVSPWTHRRCSAEFPTTTTCSCLHGEDFWSVAACGLHLGAGCFPNPTKKQTHRLHCFVPIRLGRTPSMANSRRQHEGRNNGVVFVYPLGLGGRPSLRVCLDAGALELSFLTGVLAPAPSARDNRACLWSWTCEWCRNGVERSEVMGRVGLFCVWHHAPKRYGVRFFTIFPCLPVHLHTKQQWRCLYRSSLEYHCHFLILVNSCSGTSLVLKVERV
jgi:hypothetical protein